MSVVLWILIRIPLTVNFLRSVYQVLWITNQILAK